MVKLIHISDLHFSVYSWNPLQIFSKRIVGNLSLALKRKKQLSPQLLNEFIDTLDSLEPTHVLISGDFTSTAYHKEYAFSLTFIQAIQKKGILVFAIPGNHDTYTKRAHQQKLFYESFRSVLPFKGEFEFDLEKQRVAAFKLTPDLYLVLVDSAFYTSFFQSNGIFTPEIEKNLFSLLKQIPSHAKIWLSCHFPFFDFEHPKRHLIGSEKLKKIIEAYSPQIECYFHGHTHRQIVADLRPSGLPIISDSGSLIFKHCSTFNIIEASQKEIKLSRMLHDQKYHPSETLFLSRQP